MIYFLHGTDADKARKKAQELVSSLLKKKPDASFFKIDADSFDESLLQGYIEGQGLFESKYIVFLNRICEDKKLKDDFLGKVKEMGESTNIFIILEGKLDKVSLGKIEKKAEKTQEFILEKEIEKPQFNSFAMADVLGKRDRKNLWVLYRKAIDRGEVPEAIHGMLFWKVKTMLTTFSTSYKKDELYRLAEKLIIIYHDSRRGMGELENKIEEFILDKTII